MEPLKDDPTEETSMPRKYFPSVAAAVESKLQPMLINTYILSPLLHFREIYSQERKPFGVRSMHETHMFGGVTVGWHRMMHLHALAREEAFLFCLCSDAFHLYASVRLSDIKRSPGRGDPQCEDLV